MAGKLETQINVLARLALCDSECDNGFSSDAIREAILSQALHVADIAREETGRWAEHVGLIPDDGKDRTDPSVANWWTKDHSRDVAINVAARVLLKRYDAAGNMQDNTSEWDALREALKSDGHTSGT